MKLTWRDTEDIAWALLDQYPNQDPLRLSFPKLQKMITELPDFEDDPNACDEHVLEDIQMEWFEERK